MKTKRFMGLLLALMLLIQMMPQEVYANAYSDIKITVVNYETGSIGEEIEKIYNDLTRITDLTITDGVVNYTDFQWIDENLENLGVLVINGNARVDSTTDVDVDDPDDTIPASIFKENSSLSQVTITSATNISDSAFEECKSLTTVDFPEVTTIDERAFDHCTKLITADIPKVMNIGPSAFYHCEKLKTVDFPLITTVNDNVFANCYDLVNINMPNITSIGEYSFACNYSLTDVYFSEVTTIGYAAFNECESLETIELPKVTEIGAYAFELTALVSVSFPNVTTLNRDVFKRSPNLETVNMPKITSIGNTAFSECVNLVSVDFPEVTSIGSMAFASCAELEEINVPKVESIGSRAFEYCTKLEELNFPEAKSIDELAFRGCSVLANLTLNEEPPTVESNTFLNCPTERSIKVPAGAAATYMADDKDGVPDDELWYGWRIEEKLKDGNSYSDGALIIETFTTGSIKDEIEAVNSPLDEITSLTITEGVVNSDDFEWVRIALTNLEKLEISGNAKVDSTADSPVTEPNNTVPEDAFSEWQSLREVTIISAKTINESAFYRCKSLTSVDLPEVTTIGESAFEHCTNLTNVNSPKVTNIDDLAFANCEKLTEANFPLLTTVNDEVFYMCNALSDINIPNITSIGESSFAQNHLLTDVNFSEVTTIGSGAFSECINLETIELPNVTTLKSSVFSGCANLETVNMPMITSIGDMAFEFCVGLKELNIPNVESIGESAFRDCSLLASLTLNDEPPIVESQAFLNCPTDRTIIVPAGATPTYKADDTDGDDNADLWYGWKINTLPIGSDNSVTVFKNDKLIFNLNDFPFDDPNGNILEGISVESVEGLGTLKLGDEAVVTTTSVLKLNIDNGEFTFEPNKDDIGVDYASFTYKLFNGIAYSDEVYEMTIDVVVDDAEIVALDKADLEIGYKDGESADNILTDITLPTVGNNGSDINWSSSAEGIISNQGNVTRPSSNAGEITLTATISKGDVNDTKEFVLIVKKKKSSKRSGSRDSGDSSSSESVDTLPTSEEKDFAYNKSLEVETVVEVETTNDGKTVATITFDQELLEEQLVNKGEGVVITLSVDVEVDTVVGELSGDLIKKLESKEAVIELKTIWASYLLPAKLLSIDAIVAQLGGDVELDEIKIQIEISKSSDDIVKIIEEVVQNDENTLVAPPIDFKVSVIYNNQKVAIDKFNGYVERTITLPDDIDPNRVYTGLVLNPDGSFRHVPTKIVMVDGKYYAKINSVTNSTYFVITSIVEFVDVENHWAKEYVNELGSRKIISGVDESKFMPDRDITRAEFITLIVRALGLKTDGTTTVFKDVNDKSWFIGAVSAASEYNLVSGYDGNFNPNKAITRQEAMSIMIRAMMINNLEIDIDEVKVEVILDGYLDSDMFSEWAREAAAICVDNDIIKGNDSRLKPTESITRAETATIIMRLLKMMSLV